MEAGDEEGVTEEKKRGGWAGAAEAIRSPIADMVDWLLDW